ncbi:MAG: sensor histidine kinase [Burkholderiales bacterium]
MDEKLTAAVVHDMKNALGVLEGQLAILCQNNPEVAASHALCTSLRQKLIGFLTLYKGEMTARISDVCPEDFLAEVRDLVFLPPDAPEIEMTVSPNTPVIWFFDERLIQLALEAAIQNALRFARSRISLGARREGDFLVFSVRDDGPGLGTVEEMPSTGLGTELCRTIAGAHVREGVKGHVSLANAAEGGALFEIWLP